MSNDQILNLLKVMCESYFGQISKLVSVLVDQ